MSENSWNQIVKIHKNKHKTFIIKVEFVRNILELSSHETPTTKGGDSIFIFFTRNKYNFLR